MKSMIRVPFLITCILFFGCEKPDIIEMNQGSLSQVLPGKPFPMPSPAGFSMEDLPEASRATLPQGRPSPPEHRNPEMIQRKNIQRPPLPTAPQVSVSSPNAYDDFLAGRFGYLDSDNVPPDTYGAVSTDRLLVSLNSFIRIQDRSGIIIKTVWPWTFFEQAGRIRKSSDPKVLFDSEYNRWIITACVDANPGASDTSWKPGTILGISDSTDPDGAWRLFRLDADPDLWADQPRIGYNHDWIVITANMYSYRDKEPDNKSKFKQVKIYAIPKEKLYDINISDLSYFPFDDTTGFAISPARHVDSRISDPLYLVWQTYKFTTITNEDTALHINKIEAAADGTPSYTIDHSTVSLDNPGSWDIVPPHEYFLPQLLDPPNPNGWIDADDARLQNVIFRHGSLWTAHTVFLPASGVTRSAVQWWQLKPDGDILDRSLIIDYSNAENRTYFAYPSLAVNTYGDMLIGYSQFSIDTHPSAGYNIHTNEDAKGTIRANTIFKKGTGAFIDLSNAKTRWGDYSASVVDPVNDTDFWTIQAYGAKKISSDWRWGTWWSQIKPPITVRVGTAVVDESAPRIRILPVSLESHKPIESVEFTLVPKTNGLINSDVVYEALDDSSIPDDLEVTVNTTGSHPVITISGKSGLLNPPSDKDRLIRKFQIKYKIETGSIDGVVSMTTESPIRVLPDYTDTENVLWPGEILP